MKHRKGSTTKSQFARPRELGAEPEQDPQAGARRARVAETPDKRSSRSDQDRLKDALEDDDVREALRESRRRSG